MATLEDIVGIVFIVLIFLAASVLLMNNYARITAEKDKFSLQYELEDTYSSTFDTLLEVTEPKSKRNYGELMASATYYRNENVNTKVGHVHIEEDFEILLDQVFPRKNYFFEVQAPIDSIEIIFIVDGSETVADEHAYLAGHMDTIITDIRGELGREVGAKVIIIDYENSTKCDVFSVDCVYYDFSDLYFNGTYDVWDLKKHSNDLFAPYFIDEEDEVWKSDWETAMISHVLKYQSEDLKDIRIYFPLTDSMPAATEFFFPCPRDYSMDILERDISILRMSGVIVNPILSQNNDPVLYCDQEVIDHLESLIQYNNGIIIRNRDNFAGRIAPTVKKNFNSMIIQIGEKRVGRTYGLQRKLPMPNGELADALLQIYTEIE